MKFNVLLNERIRNLFLIMWPPFGEDHDAATSIAIGICFYDRLEMYVISTDKADNWSPKVTIEEEPKFPYSHLEFHVRLDKWRNCELEEVIDKEYYDFTKSKIFREIVDHNILDIEFIGTSNEKPFGVKLKFESDYLMLTPIADGSTVESKNFGLLRNIDSFRNFGKIEFLSIKHQAGIVRRDE